MFYICAILKDEHLFLKEWIDYHLSIGFDKIFLYEDFDSKSHSEITSLYDKVELHSMKEVSSCIPGKTGRQIAVYNYFCETHKNGWCLFIDIDEYLRLDDGVSLSTISNEFNDCAGIEIMWKCYGANNYITRPTGSIQEAYSPDYKNGFNPYWKFKSFVNLRKSGNMHFINCHYHRHVVNTKHERGDFRQHKNKLYFDLCHIDHYITKSWEDYIERLKRGNITKGLRNVDYFFEVNKNMIPMKEELSKHINLNEFPTI